MSVGRTVQKPSTLGAGVWLYLHERNHLTRKMIAQNWWEDVSMEPQLKAAGAQTPGFHSLIYFTELFRIRVYMSEKSEKTHHCHVEFDVSLGRNLQAANHRESVLFPDMSWLLFPGCKMWLNYSHSLFSLEDMKKCVSPTCQVCLKIERES